MFVHEKLNIWFVTSYHRPPRMTGPSNKGTSLSIPPLILWFCPLCLFQQTPLGGLTLISIWISDKHKALSLMFLNKGKKIWIIFSFRIVHWDKMPFHFSIRYSQLSYTIWRAYPLPYNKCLFPFYSQVFLGFEKSSIKVKKTMFGMFWSWKSV